MATITDDCKRAFTGISVAAGGLVTLELYLRGDDIVDDVRHLPLNTAMVNFQVFSRWLHGAAGAATYESASVPIQLNTEAGKLGRVFIQLTLSPSQLKLLNDADEFRFSYLGDDYICEVTIPEYIIQDGLRSYASQTFDRFTLNRIISMTARESATGRFTITGTASYPSDVVSLSFVRVTGAGTITNVDSVNALSLPNFFFDLIGTDVTRNTIAVDLAVGGAKSGNVLSHSVPLTLLPSSLPRPVIPNFERVSVDITRVISETEGQVTAEFTVTPPLVSGSGGLLELTLSETRPQVRDIGTQRTANLLTTSLTRAGIERGKSYRVVVAWKAGNNVNHFSAPYYFRYAQTLVQESDVDHLSQQVRASRIFATDNRPGFVSFDVINDIFLSDFVDSITASWRSGRDTPTVVVDNDRTSSIISITANQVPQDVRLEITLTAQTQFGDVTIAQVAVRTISAATIMTQAATPDKRAVNRILSLSYDADILSIIDDLPETCKQNIAERSVEMMNNPENDGYAHDFNKFNKRGSIFANRNSDLSKTKYTETIDTTIGDISEIVPDIDAGSPF